MKRNLLNLAIIFILFITTFLAPCILRKAIIYNPAKDIVPKLKVTRISGANKNNMWKNIKNNKLHKKANMNLRMIKKKLNKCVIENSILPESYTVS